MTSQYSDLEAVREYDQPGLEHNPVVEHQVLPGKYADAPKYFDDQDLRQPATLPRRRICGLAPKTFWIVAAIVAAVVIGAAVGGGVGATESHKNTTVSDQTSSSSLSSTAAPSPTTSDSTPSLTTTPVVGPSATLLRDCPSSNNTLLTINPGTSMSFRKICGTTFLNAINGANVVETTTTSLNDCINLCGAYNVANETSIAKGTNNVCNAVCWRNSFVNDDFPGMCFGFTTQNSSNAFVTQTEAICDGAAWIDQSF